MNNIRFVDDEYCGEVAVSHSYCEGAKRYGRDHRKSYAT